MEKLNTRRRRQKWLEQGNQNTLCGPIMRWNCCCDSHSTTMRVSCKKGSIASAAQTQACSPPLLLSLLWDVAGFRGRRQVVVGWDDGVIDKESMQIPCPHENTREAFLDFSTLRPGFKKVRLQALCLQDQCGGSMQNMCIYIKECFHVDGLLNSVLARVLNPTQSLKACQLPSS